MIKLPFLELSAITCPQVINTSSKSSFSKSKSLVRERQNPVFKVNYIISSLNYLKYWKFSMQSPGIESSDKWYTCQSLDFGVQYF